MQVILQISQGISYILESVHIQHLHGVGAQRVGYR